MLKSGYEANDLKYFQLSTLEVKSQHLKGNPLKDPNLRKMPVLLPKKEEVRAVVWVLAGFGGNGPKYLNQRPFEKNFVQNIDEWFGQKKAPAAAYVFIDAWTALGGSQFVNSSAIGDYEDYLVKEVQPVLAKEFPQCPHVLMGGSSGGYGALHLASKFPQKFSYIGAFAPDAYFDLMFLPEFLKTVNFYSRPNINIKKMVRTGELFQLRDWHSILNVYAMSACYSPKGKEAEIPFDFYEGKLIPERWRKWRKKDPIVFLPARLKNVKKIKGIYLEVGKKDQFYLQFGARKIHQFLKAKKIRHHYKEFDGGHFDLSSRRAGFLDWLNKKL